jgi:hypothetical protein
VNSYGGAVDVVPLAAELAGGAIFDSSDIDDTHSLAMVTKAVLLPLALEVELERAASASQCDERGQP